MLAVFLMALAAAATGHAVHYISGKVAVRLGHEREVGYRAAGSAGFSLIATPRKGQEG